MENIEAYKKLIKDAELRGPLVGFLASMKAKIESGEQLSPKMVAALDRMLESKVEPSNPDLPRRLGLRFSILKKLNLGFSTEFVSSLYDQFQSKKNLSEKQVIATSKLLKKFRSQIDTLREQNIISKDEMTEMFLAINELPQDEFELSKKLQVEVVCDGFPSEWISGPWTDELEAKLRSLAETRIKSATTWVRRAQDAFELADNVSRPYRSVLEMQCREVLKSGKVVNWFYYIRAGNETGENAKLFFYKG